MCMAGCSAGTTCATPRRRGDCRAPRLWSRRCGRNTRSKSCWWRSEEHTSELQSRLHLVCRLLLEKKKKLHRAELAHDDALARAPARRGRPTVFSASEREAATASGAFRVSLAFDLHAAPASRASAH